MSILIAVTLMRFIEKLSESTSNLVSFKPQLEFSMKNSSYRDGEISSERTHDEWILGLPVCNGLQIALETRFALNMPANGVTKLNKIQKLPDSLLIVLGVYPCLQTQDKNEDICSINSFFDVTKSCGKVRF